jgi:polygalacturonase
MCKDVVIDKVKVFNPWYSQNGDALDLESCNRVLVSNCVFDAGDDAICLKSGKDEQGRKRGVPCQNIVVINNTVLHGHGGFVVGSEMSGGVKNIFVSNCSFLGTDVGLRFKSNRGRGGVVENIFIENINMINIPNEAILFNLYYGGKSREEEANDSTVEESAEIYPVTEETPCFRNIDIKDVTCYDAGRAMQFKGLPEMRIDNVKMENINVMNCTDGIELDEVSNADFKNINITLKKDGEKINIQNCSRININGREYNKIGKKNLMIGLSDKQR